MNQDWELCGFQKPWQQRTFFFHGAGGVWMQSPNTNLRDGGVEARDLEIWVGWGRTIPLHGNKPGRRNLMGVLQRNKEKGIVNSQHSRARNVRGRKIRHESVNTDTHITLLPVHTQQPFKTEQNHIYSTLCWRKCTEVFKRANTTEMDTIVFSFS